MFNKFFWMIALILLTAGSMFIPGLLGNDPPVTTADPTICENCTIEVTEEPFETHITGGLADTTAIPDDLSGAAVSSTQPHLLPTSTKTAASVGMPFVVQLNSPVYMGNFVHENYGCSWSGVAGQVFGSDGQPLTNIIVRVTGRYNKRQINRIGITGMQAGSAYGPGGFEIRIGLVAKATRNRLKIQLFSLENKPLSSALRFNTYSDCKKNLAIINFMDSQGISVVIPTSTKTPALALTSTLVATNEVTNTFTPTVTLPPENTPSPSATNPPVATKTSTIQPGTFKLQPNTPAYLGNFVHTDSGCAWQGVAGQVFDKNGTPLTNLVIKITGNWNGNSISKVALTGMVNGLPYGPGSYEIVLGTSAVVSDDTLQIQVFDSNSKALTDIIPFDTFADCSKNLMIINFKQY